MKTNSNRELGEGQIELCYRTWVPEHIWEGQPPGGRYGDPRGSCLYCRHSKWSDLDFAQGQADTIQPHIPDTDQRREQQGRDRVLLGEEDRLCVQGEDTEEGQQVPCLMGQGAQDIP